MSLPARILSAVVGVVLIVAGIFLLTHPVTTSSSRLARVAGIMIVMGLVALALAAFGRF